ncbi:MAG: hypothetical protein AAGA48_06755 [Myxococcota bacterium]
MWVWWLLASCTSRFVFDDPTCDADFVDWAGGLTNDVLQGSGDGAFDYIPRDSDIVVQMAGEYDLRTGDLEWERTYVEGAFRRSESAEGQGTLWPDGDLDLEYDLEVTLPLIRRSIEVRDLRLGCDVNRRVEDEQGRVEIYRGELTDDGLLYTHEFVDGARTFVADGERLPDGSWTESLNFQGANLTYMLDESGNARDVSWRRDLVYETADTLLNGFYRRRANGRMNVEYRAIINDGVPEFWNYGFDSEGNGTGTLTFEDGTPACTLTFQRGACTVTDCDAEGTCVPPLVLDEVLLRL